MADKMFTLVEAAFECARCGKIKRVRQNASTSKIIEPAEKCECSKKKPVWRILFGESKYEDVEA